MRGAAGGTAHVLTLLPLRRLWLLMFSLVLVSPIFAACLPASYTSLCHHHPLPCSPPPSPTAPNQVRDSLGRLVELPIDTHPGHYRRETATIHSSAIVRLASQLRKFPPGECVWWGCCRREWTIAAVAV